MGDREDENGLLGARRDLKKEHDELQLLSPEDSRVEDDDDVGVDIRLEDDVYAPVSNYQGVNAKGSRLWFWVKLVTGTLTLVVVLVMMFGGDDVKKTMSVQPHDWFSWYRPAPKPTDDQGVVTSPPTLSENVEEDVMDYNEESNEDVEEEEQPQIDYESNDDDVVDDETTDDYDNSIDAGEGTDEAYLENTEADEITKEQEGTNDDIVAVDTFQKTRIVFFAGPQKAGHEAMENAIAAACKGSKKCQRLCELSHPELWYPKTLGVFSTRRDRAVEELKKVASEGRTDTIYFINLYGECPRENGVTDSKLAYPQKEMHYSSDHFPQVPEMQRIADEVDGDLEIRTVFLVHDSRSAESLGQEMVKSNPMSAHRVLLYVRSAFEALFAQLYQLDQNLYRGFDMMNIKFAGDGTLDDFVGLAGLTEHLKEKVTSLREAADLAGKMDEDAALHLLTLDPILTVTWNTLENGGYAGVKPKRVAGAVKKTVFHTPEDPKPIVFFMAGLEGTGHHLWKSVFTTLITKEHAFGIDCAIQQKCYDHTLSKTLFLSDNLPHYQYAVENIKPVLESLGKDPAAKGVTYPINLLQARVVCDTRSGMLSYPNFKGTYKNIQRADMIVLARLMDEAGIDFRFIIMSRDSNAVIKSTVDNRSFGTAPQQIKVLESNAYAILTQTATVDEQFMPSCVQYEDSDFNYVDSFAKGLYMDPAIVRKVLSDTIHFHKGEMTKNVELREAFESSMHATLAATAKMCPNKLIDTSE